MHEEDGAERDDDHQRSDVVRLPLHRRVDRSLAVRSGETRQRHFGHRQHHVQAHGDRALAKMHSNRCVSCLPLYHYHGRITYNEESVYRSALLLFQSLFPFISLPSSSCSPPYFHLLSHPLLSSFPYSPPSSSAPTIQSGIFFPNDNLRPLQKQGGVCLLAPQHSHSTVLITYCYRGCLRLLCLSTAH